MSLKGNRADLYSLQIPQSPIQAIPSARYCPIHETVNLRSDNARIARVDIVIPQRAVNDGTFTNDQEGSSEDDGEVVQAPDGR